MGVVTGARITVKEDGRERCRKRLGENDNAEQKEQREKGLSWGVSGLGYLWTPCNKESRQLVWRSVRRKARSNVSRQIEYDDKYVRGIVALAFPRDVRQPSQDTKVIYVDGNGRHFGLCSTPEDVLALQRSIDLQNRFYHYYHS
jgi:hypothetical protein